MKKAKFQKAGMIFVLIMAMFAASIAGCGASSETASAVTMEMAAGNSYSARSMDGGIYDSAAEAVAEEPAAEYEEGAIADEAKLVDDANPTDDAQARQRKLIKNVDMSVETENFDGLLANVNAKVDQLGGYIESSNVYNGSYTSSFRSRSASITARIPADNLDQFVTDLSEWSNMIRKNEYVEDVTLTYVDLESHKKALKAEQESLLAMLEKAETIEDIITINSQLTSVRYQIESMESQLRTYDNKINYSTVYLDVEEVATYEPYVAKSAGERISEGFMNNVYKVTDGIQEFFIELIIALPILFVAAVVIGIGIVILIIIIKAAEKHSAKRREKILRTAGKASNPGQRYRNGQNQEAVPKQSQPAAPEQSADSSET